MSTNSEKEPSYKGKLIQEHLENINMDPWYYIYQVYVNPKTNDKKKSEEN